MQTTLTQQRSSSFWDGMARKYAKKPIKDPGAYAAKLAAVRALVKPNDTMLEIGCGTGTTALKLAPGVASYTATDCSREMIAIAEEKRGSAAVGNLRFAVADAARRVPGAPFDVVAGFSVLHLVDDLPTVLRAIHDQLRPGGVFVSKTVCLGDANVFIRLLVKALSAVGLAPQVLSFRRADLREELLRAGFEVEDCQFFGKSRMNPFFVARRPA